METATPDRKPRRPFSTFQRLTLAGAVVLTLGLGTAMVVTADDNDRPRVAFPTETTAASASSWTVADNEEFICNFVTRQAEADPADMPSLVHSALSNVEQNPENYSEYFHSLLQRMAIALDSPDYSTSGLYSLGNEFREYCSS
jgi:hypothetical protein